ncbi:hypothetical protein [Streptomyces sp. NPDC060002]|uniref:hypothetical protein n=1 Tax=Streptomyces sp. NPDC060002 TaxID=3347033 RepID=UPI0036C2B670
MTRIGTDDFPAGLDHWTDRDWEDYRARIEHGEGSVSAIDAVQRRRRCRVLNEPPQESAR